jgi:serine/threonine-protein kinase HipA
MREILRLISDWSDEPEDDRATLLESLGLSWAIGGSDAHAKNYAFLHTPGERVGLAPHATAWHGRGWRARSRVDFGT